MRKRFVHSHYYRELYQKLQNLYQGSMSVEDYYTEMEVAMIRANVVEDREATMVRFLGGLNREIANVVELHHYVDLDEMLHMAIKVERQLRKKSTFRYSSQSSSAWKDKWDKEENKIAEVATPKLKSEVVVPKIRDVQCFKCNGRGHIASQCPNKRTLITRQNARVRFNI